MACEAPAPERWQAHRFTRSCDRRPAPSRRLSNRLSGRAGQTSLSPALTHAGAFQRRGDRWLQNYTEAEARIIALPGAPAEVLQPAGLQGSTSWQQVVGLCALVAVICSVDRAAMSVALGPMGAEHPEPKNLKTFTPNPAP